MYVKAIKYLNKVKKLVRNEIYLYNYILRISAEIKKNLLARKDKIVKAFKVR